MMCGGLGNENAADAEVQQLIESSIVKFEAEKKYNSPFGEYRAVSYKSQVVAGTMYYVKVRFNGQPGVIISTVSCHNNVHLGGETFIHMKVFRPLPHVNSPPTLEDIQVNKNRDDPVEYF